MAPRGSAMLLTMAVSVIVLVIVTGIMSYAFNEKLRAIGNARRLSRTACAEAGLSLAKSYFLGQFNQWNTLLANGTIYNHLSVDGGVTDLQNPLWQGANAPQLFADLDGDGQADVYIYMKDNQDEMIGSPDNPAHDNDQNVIIGSICISRTMAPRMANGQLSPTLQVVEGVLTGNNVAWQYAQAVTGNGTGNLNGSRQY